MHELSYRLSEADYDPRISELPPTYQKCIREMLGKDPHQSNAAKGIEAILDRVMYYSRPMHFMSDLQIDFHTLWVIQPRAFLFLMRDSGTQIATTEQPSTFAAVEYWFKQHDARLFLIRAFTREEMDDKFEIAKGKRWEVKEFGRYERAPQMAEHELKELYRSFAL